MSGKFYKWNGHTLVLDPGVFSWDLPRRGADWQVGYFPRDGMGTNGTVTTELDEAGEHLIRAGEAAIREVEPVVTKAPDRFIDYAHQHPWMTLMFGVAGGVFLTKYVQRRRMAANPLEYKVGDTVANTAYAIGRVIAVHDDYLLVKDEEGHKYKWPYVNLMEPGMAKRFITFKEREGSR